MSTQELNSMIFFTMLIIDANESIMKYLCEDLNLLHDMSLQLKHYETYLEQAEREKDEFTIKQSRLLFVTYLHGLVLAIDEVFGPNHAIEIERMISGKKQY